jgi:hypothetical protein
MFDVSPHWVPLCSQSLPLDFLVLLDWPPRVWLFHFIQRMGPWGFQPYISAEIPLGRTQQVPLFQVRFTGTFWKVTEYISSIRSVPGPLPGSCSLCRSRCDRAEWSGTSGYVGS